MLSRTDYINLCNVLADTVVGNGKFMDNLATFLGTDNPKFNREKFDAYIIKLVNAKRERKAMEAKDESV